MIRVAPEQRRTRHPPGDPSYGATAACRPVRSCEGGRCVGPGVGRRRTSSPPSRHAIPRAVGRVPRGDDVGAVKRGGEGVEPWNT